MTRALPKLSLHEFLIIDEHLENLQIAAESAYVKFRDIPDSQKSEYTRNQATYWRNVRAGLRWARQNAKQRKDRNNGIRFGGIQ